jgi:hypothetical protein
MYLYRDLETLLPRVEAFLKLKFLINSVLKLTEMTFYIPCFLTKFNNLSQTTTLPCILNSKKAYIKTLRQRIWQIYLTGTVVSKLAFSRDLELKRLRNTALGDQVNVGSTTFSRNTKTEK